LPERLFKLHDSPLENQPAVRIENMEVQPISALLLADLSALITRQQARILALIEQVHAEQGEAQ